MGVEEGGFVEFEEGTWVQGSKGRGRSWGKRKELRGEKNKRERESEREGRSR